MIARLMTLWRTHALPLTLGLTSFVFALGGPTVTDALRYERGAILAGQWWRLLTGNLVHLGWAHLIMNIVGLALIWALFRERLPQKMWMLITGACGLAVGLGLLAFMPRLEWYVGLSGMLHGLFAAGIIASLRGGDRWDWLLLAGFTGKVLWEQFNGALPGSAETAGGAVIVDAHFYGAITGAVLTSIWLARQRAVRRPIG